MTTKPIPRYLPMSYASDTKLMPLTRKQKQLVEAIEEAEWIGHDSTLHVSELQYVNKRIKSGELYEPLF